MDYFKVYGIVLMRLRITMKILVRLDEIRDGGCQKSLEQFNLINVPLTDHNMT